MGEKVQGQKAAWTRESRDYHRCMSLGIRIDFPD